MQQYIFVIIFIENDLVLRYQHRALLPRSRIQFCNSPAIIIDTVKTPKKNANIMPAITIFYIFEIEYGIGARNIDRTESLAIYN